MFLTRYRDSLEFLWVFLSLFFSNLLVLVFHNWLNPNYLLVQTIIWVVIGIVNIWIMKGKDLLPSFVQNLKVNWFIMPFLFFSGLSILWSVYWQISLYRWLAFVATFFTGAYIGIRFNLLRIIRYITIFVLWIIFLSMIVVIITPSMGVMNYYIIQGAWKGIYWHKNHMGFIAAFGNILCLLNMVNAIQIKSKIKFLWGILYLMTLFFIIQTDSVGAFISSILTHGVIILAWLWIKFRNRIHRTHIITFGVFFVIVAILVFANLDLVFGIFNRQTSLTGRIPMWTYLFNTYFSKKLFFGYGFNAFWYLSSYREDMHIAAGYPDDILIADNGFIDLLINTGIVGFTLFLLFYLTLWWRTLRSAFFAENIYEFFPTILMSFVLIANVTWSLLFENESFFMLLMMVVLFYITKSEQLEFDV